MARRSMSSSSSAAAAARRSSALLAALCGAVAVRLLAAGVGETFAGAALRRTGSFAAAPLSLRRAEEAAADSGLGMCTGRCRGDGNWTEERSLPILSEEEEKQADQVYELFKKAYTKAAESGIFIDTPVEERDVKYRWRRFRNTLGVSGEKSIEILQVDPLPLVVDADYVEETWNAMVRGSDKETALEVIMNNPGVVTAGTEIEDRMDSAKMAAGFIGGFRAVQNLFR
mmetsp:Transcript_105966/g.274192  ORF Transcript_105966/g.274192 Transcript_105966/m.274192 type:complete len:228 (+) Transcript_105966:81-764(+)